MVGLWPGSLALQSIVLSFALSPLALTYRIINIASAYVPKQLKSWTPSDKNARSSEKHQLIFILEGIALILRISTSHQISAPS